MNEFRILLIDDQNLFIETLKSTLESIDNFIVDVSHSLEKTKILKQAVHFNPTVILLDIHLGPINGLDLAPELMSLIPKASVVMLTAFGYEEYIQKAKVIGASGILLKDISFDVLVSQLKTVSKETFITFNSPASTIDNSSLQEAQWLSYLSKNEQRLLRLIVEGYSNEDIANRMNLGKQTVKNYVSGLYKKMDVQNRFQAIRKAIEECPHLFSRRY